MLLCNLNHRELNIICQPHTIYEYKALYFFMFTLKNLTRMLWDFQSVWNCPMNRKLLQFHITIQTFEIKIISKKRYVGTSKLLLISCFFFKKKYDDRYSSSSIPTDSSSSRHNLKIFFFYSATKRKDKLSVLTTNRSVTNAVEVFMKVHNRIDIVRKSCF